MGKGGAGGAKKNLVGFTEKEEEILISNGIYELNKSDIINTFAGRSKNSRFRSDDINVRISDNNITITGKSQETGASVHRVIDLKNKSVSHGSLNMGDARGASHGKSIMRRQLNLYDKLKLKEITTLALNVGGYAWARYGFNASTEDRWSIIKRVAKDHNLSTESLGFSKEKPPVHMAQIAAMRIRISDYNFTGRQSIESQIQEMRREGFIKGKSVLIGKITLLNESWDGKLNLAKNRVDRKILEAYLDIKRR